MSKYRDKKSGKVKESGKCSLPTDSDVFSINLCTIDRCEVGTDVSILASWKNSLITCNSSANLPWFSLSDVSMYSSSFSDSSTWLISAETAHVDKSGNLFN